MGQFSASPAELARTNRKGPPGNFLEAGMLNNSTTQHNTNFNQPPSERGPAQTSLSKDQLAALA